MRDLVYPGGLSELDFVSTYANSTLRKPQVVADSALRTLVLASQADRIVLTGLIAEQLAEACRRLTAVYRALSNRQNSAAKWLLGPLPGVEPWKEMIQDAATLTPEQLVRHLGIDDSAQESAERLRGQPDLSRLTELVSAAATGGGMLLIPWLESHRGPLEILYAGCTIDDVDGDFATVGVDESDAAMLADLTADMSSIARGFLQAYLGARRGAGRVS
jgi:hypothetical protein